MIFICSPYKGDTVRNIQRAQRYCRMAVDEGYMPIAPHLFYPQFLDDDDSEERTLGMTFGLALLDLCDEIWVFGEPTPGMAVEIAFTAERHIPIKQFPAEPNAGKERTNA